MPRGLAACTRTVSYTHLDVYKRQGLWRVPAGGVAGQLALPFDGQVPWMQGAASSSTVLVAMTGWFTPSTVFRLDVDSGRMQDLALVPPLPFDTGGYEARRALVTVRDGTRVPYTVVAVSYTHLDVYKRQKVASSLEFDIQVLYKSPPNPCTKIKTCLLYTSRCV